MMKTYQKQDLSFQNLLPQFSQCLRDFKCSFCEPWWQINTLQGKMVRNFYCKMLADMKTAQS